MHPLYEPLRISKAYAEYARLFFDSTGLSLRLVPSDSREIASAKEGCFVSEFCRRMRRMEATGSHCRKTHETLAGRAQRKLAPQYSSCTAKLHQSAVPIVVEGGHVATLMTGCVVCHTPTEKDLARMAGHLRRRGVNEEIKELLRAFLQLPAIPWERQRSLANLLMFSAEHLAASIQKEVLAMDNREHQAVRRAKEFIRSGTTPIRLSTVATHAGLSCSQLERVFKQSTGMTLLQYATLLRIDRAAMLLSGPTKKVIDVALESGFGSLSQFNRAFKKQRGRTPTEWRKQIQAGAFKASCSGEDLKSSVKNLTREARVESQPSLYPGR